MNLRELIGSTLAVVACAPLFAYEINNHADISDTSVRRSVLGQEVGPARKLFRIGLRPFDLDDTNQTFPLTLGLPEMRKCFGELDNGSQEPGTSQPGWSASAGRTNLQIVQLFRYGACYEDNVDASGARVLTHFYDPQHQGRGLNGFPSSVDWMLNPSASSTIVATNDGRNHYGWKDARGFFYDEIGRAHV